MDSICEELDEAKPEIEKLSVNEKATIRCLSSSNDKLRVDCEDKHWKWEEERCGLLLALDEANINASSQFAVSKAAQTS
ncbi:hypothetical protein GH714_016973 [Hevea brasiliensis]|uniref:Uncharacterized protein n=1 Tax=Hevea brasiliensis TaxID=3981 RepID=A0A6A6K652_HEVBR|nr:hypothetical protein GH714_016973 [Hevea brasiliensis]